MINIRIKNKILVLILFTVVLLLTGFEFTKEALAETSGWFRSTNLLQGVFPEPTSIDKFVYTLSAKPPGTTATVGFNQDGGATWYNAAGVEGRETLVVGTNNTITLTSGWSGANFYYRIDFTSEGTDTPILDEITLIYTKEETAGCETIIPAYGAPDCEGYHSMWTWCKCKPEKSEGYRISPEFDISRAGEKVKDSRIFWQADERTEGTIKVKVNVFSGTSWSDWQEVVNGGQIPGLEPGTDLSGAKIQTKISFVGGPDFYPSLENIKIFVEIE